MANQYISSESSKQNLIAAGLSLPEKDDFVRDVSFGYNVLNQVISMINKTSGGSKQIWQRKFNTSQVGNLSIAQTVATSAVSGANLLVTWNSPNDNWRENDVIMDSNQIKGIIVQVVSSTQVLLGIAQDGLTAWSAATHFTAGMTAKRLFSAMKSRGSRGRTSLQVTPTEKYNYVGVSRDTQTLYVDDFIKSYVTTEDGYWYTSQQMFCLQQFAKQDEFKAYWSDRYAINEGTNSEILMTGGVRWNIINNGGFYHPLTGIPGRDEVDYVLNEMAKRVVTKNRRLVAFCGQQALSNLQRITTNPVTYSGNQNTFGGMDVKGWNVMTYGQGGVFMDYVHMPLFDDPTMFPEISTITNQPRMSSSILLMDLTPIETYGHGTIPCIQKKYFGPTEYAMGYQNGIIDLNNMNGASGTMTADQHGAFQMVSDSDGCDFHVYSVSGYDIVADRMALLELPS